MRGVLCLTSKENLEQLAENEQQKQEQEELKRKRKETENKRKRKTKAGETGKEASEEQAVTEFQERKDKIAETS